MAMGFLDFHPAMIELGYSTVQRHPLIAWYQSFCEGLIQSCPRFHQLKTNGKRMHCK